MRLKKELKTTFKYFRLSGLRQIILHVRLRFTPFYFWLWESLPGSLWFFGFGQDMQTELWDKSRCGWWKRFFHVAHEYMAWVHTGMGLRWNFVNMNKKTFVKPPLSIRIFLPELTILLSSDTVLCHWLWYEKYKICWSIWLLHVLHLNKALDSIKPMLF